MVRMNACCYNQQSLIRLSPFFHQVGGHSSIFQYDKDTVCKVLESSELDFYQSMPDLLKKFTPEFRGIITAQYYEDELGYITLVAQPQTTCASNDKDESHLLHDDDQSTTTVTNDQQFIDNTIRRSVQLRCSEDGHIDYSNSLGTDAVNYEQGKITTSKINPWSLQLCIKQAEKLHRQFTGNENVAISQQYILLENVAAQFHYPCILDLKMGKRQHADVDSDKKRQSKIQKCESSTSSTLGVRLCGMQVYQIDSGRYIFTDKYRGRTLTVDGFRSTLVEFFNNGHTKRFDVVPGIIAKLESLYETINFLSQYRFYSGSLLIVYDGLVQSNHVDVRMIDFAHSVHAPTNDESSEIIVHTGPDRGYLFGLEHLIQVFKGILNEENSSSIIADIDS